MSEYDKPDELLDTLPVPFTEAPVAREYLQRLLIAAQKAALQHGRGCIRWLEGHEELVYITAEAVPTTPLTPDQQDTLLQLLRSYDLPTEVVLLRVGRDRSISMMTYAPGAPPRNARRPGAL